MYPIGAGALNAAAGTAVEATAAPVAPSPPVVNNFVHAAECYDTKRQRVVHDGSVVGTVGATADPYGMYYYSNVAAFSTPADSNQCYSNAIYPPPPPASSSMDCFSVMANFNSGQRDTHLSTNAADYQGANSSLFTDVFPRDLASQHPISAPGHAGANISHTAGSFGRNTPPPPPYNVPADPGAPFYGQSVTLNASGHPGADPSYMPGSFHIDPQSQPTPYKAFGHLVAKSSCMPDSFHKDSPSRPPFNIAGHMGVNSACSFYSNSPPHTPTNASGRAAANSSYLSGSSPPRRFDRHCYPAFDPAFFRGLIFPPYGQPRPFPVVRLRGLPFDCREVDIYQFFAGLEVVDVLLTHKQGRFSGEAYCVFSLPLQMDYALQRDKTIMGTRYVEVFRSKKQDYYLAVAAEATENGWALRESVAYVPSSKISSEKDNLPHTGVLKLRGLPFSASKRDIMEFFKGFEVKENNIQFVVHSDGRASGEAYVEFANPDESKQAMCKDRMTLGSRYIELFPSTHEESVRAAASH